MGKIVFFNIPAYGHTNPTVEVVRELIRRGHEVWYYSFEEFREKLEGAGAHFIPCDAFLPPAPAHLDKKVGRDFAALIEMVADTTIRLDETVCTALKKLQPDCIVADSVCFWGKLFAKKLGITFICSTTTFAFNEQTAKLMKPSFSEALRLITGMGRINSKMRLLKERGFAVDGLPSVIQNDNNTNTIVYAAKTFQPMAATFSDHFTFVGPSVADIAAEQVAKDKPLIYISLGTVLNRNKRFYKNCVEALKDFPCNVLLSVGKQTDIASLGVAAQNVQIKQSVCQMQVLKQADVFLTHSGMNSVQESIYSGVPMVFFPQHSEERLVAERACELGTGVMLQNSRPQNIRRAVLAVLNGSGYRKSTQELSKVFRSAGGAPKAADTIEEVIQNKK